MWLIARRGAFLALGGSLAGVVLARIASGMLEGLLFGVTGGDSLTIAGAVVIVLAASMMASYAPTRRILRQSPGIALRDI